jgi:hypothetical protein
MQMNSYYVYLEEPEEPFVSPLGLIIVLTLFFLAWLSEHPTISLEEIKQGVSLIFIACLFFFVTKGIENA